jgi:hypothetical protein
MRGSPCFGPIRLTGWRGKINCAELCEAERGGGAVDCVGADALMGRMSEKVFSGFDHNR